MGYPVIWLGLGEESLVERVEREGMTDGRI